MPHEWDEFTTLIPRVVKRPDGSSDVFYTQDEYQVMWQVWQVACRWQKQKDKANDET